MHLQYLRLLNFKNYAALEADFSPQINAIVGDNGTGKTNLLDAVHYLSLTKSAFNKIDTQNIKHGEDFFRIDGTFLKEDEKWDVSCRLKAGDKKVVQVNKLPYERLSEHVGRFPLVMMAPDDTDLIRGGSEDRRRFFDGIISQIDAVYLQSLMKYNHLLNQRNSLLKQFADRHYVDRTLLETYNEPLLALGKEVFERRQAFVTDFLPVFLHHYQHLTDSREEVALQYESHWQSGTFAKEFVQSINRDLYIQRTDLGIHRDDYAFSIEGHPLRKYGSQGQQKSFVIALKLAQFDQMKDVSGRKPMLLLDDIFDKLDDHRIAHLMELVADQHFGQIFLTDARPERTEKIFNTIRAEVRVFRTTFTE
ncbi:DNA replication and repair protein RecF [Catalinimonas alkaloidigena]|uniref:DNA replication and repair protein RecF n=1 Tax=Catalinimonas alkaloidigena TaxID=1075417 RepID=A0A1G9EG23_9BACT|nr:DNA replication and repair protein RecF [Catalinimonas alkaloidigena]SDK75110.1 DNA replication and repair protein RecF [Catalinimonas alkaloidigena]